MKMHDQSRNNTGIKSIYYVILIIIRSGESPFISMIQPANLHMVGKMLLSRKYHSTVFHE